MSKVVLRKLLNSRFEGYFCSIDNKHFSPQATESSESKISLCFMLRWKSEVGIRFKLVDAF